MRNNIKGDLEIIRNSKKRIAPYILSFKTRLMLKCNTIQNILIDIANIIYLLKDEKEQNQSEEDKQRIKELKMKLRKKYNEFYLIFYQNKMTSEWADEERTTEPWLRKYQQIINGEDVSFMKIIKNNNIDNNHDYSTNNNNNNKQMKDNIQKKTKKINFNNYDDLNNINNNEFNEKNFSKNKDNYYDNNYNEELSNNVTDNYNNNNYQDMQETPKLYKDDERPIKPMKNNYFMNSENPFGLSDNNNNTPISQRKSKLPKSKIKRNTGNANNSNNSNNKNENQNEEEEKQIQYQEKQMENNSQNDNSQSNNNNTQYNEYDERPISGKKIDYNAMFGEGKNFDGDGFGGMSQEINMNQNHRKIIKNKNSPRKKPVYDARKAIEEAKLREAKEGKKEKTSSFREFVKEMKKISAEEKAGQMNNENNPNNSKINSNKSLQKVKKYGKDDLPIKKNNFIEDSYNTNNTNNTNTKEEQEIQEQKTKRIIPIRGRRVETKDMIMRRKLHELERSPPPVLNIKNIKSKIECWGPSNDVKKQRLSQHIQHMNEKDKRKRKRNISKNKNYQTESKDRDSINVISINKKSIEINDNKNEKVIDPIKIEEKAKKIALKKLAKIENQISKIESEFNLDNYFKDKERKMLEFGKIPYIKKEYNYVKKYSNEVYTSLVTHLLAQYQDLK